VPAGAGSSDPYVLWRPAGPVAAGELHLLLLAGLAMAAFIVPVLLLYAYVVARYRDRPGHRAPTLPRWRKNAWLESLGFVLPALLLAVVAVPTVRLTYALAKVPTRPRPLVVDVTSLDWKWLFEYPAQGIATVNYVDIPADRPVLFELTANSPMNTFWVPRLGGMEYTMPGRVLPLWLEADRTGTFWGHSGQFSGLAFDAMFFDVRAVRPGAFRRWVAATRAHSPALTLAGYRSLLHAGLAPAERFAAFPARTFPAVRHGFTLRGGMYTTMRPASPAGHSAS